MNVLLGSFSYCVVFAISIIPYFICLPIFNKIDRFIVSSLLVQTQIIIEVFLTNLNIFNLQHIFLVHFSILITIILFKRKKRKSKKILNLKKIIRIPKLVDIYIFISILLSWISGMFGGPLSVDERAYHWPQALAIIQENKFVTFNSALPWSFSYPLGLPSINAFSFILTGNDLAFHLNSTISLLLMLLCLKQLAIQVTNTQIGTLILGGIALSPILILVSHFSTNDIQYGSCIIASIYFLYQYSRIKQNSRPYLYASLLAFSMSGQFKFPILSSAVYLPILFLSIVKLEKNKKNIQTFIIIFLSILITFIYPIRNLLKFQNPLYPMTVKVSKLTLFDGPMPNLTNSAINAHSNFDLRNASIFKLWLASLFDAKQSLSEDSLGSIHLFLGVILLILITVNLFLILKRRNRNMFFFWFLFILLIFPGLWLPRYGFAVLFLTILLGSASLKYIKINRILYFVLNLVIFSYVYIDVGQLYRDYQWINSQRENVPIWNYPSGKLDEKFPFGDSLNYVQPNQVKFIRKTVGKNEIFCYNSATNYSSLYWNVERSNKVIYLPVDNSQNYPNNNQPSYRFSQSAIKKWSETLDKCTYFLTNNDAKIEKILISKKFIVTSAKSENTKIFSKNSQS